MYVVVGLIIKGGDLHTLRPQAKDNVNHHRDRLPTDATKAKTLWLVLLCLSLETCTMPQAKAVMKTAIPIIIGQTVTALV